MVPTNSEFPSAQASSDAPASFVRLNNFEMTSHFPHINFHFVYLDNIIRLAAHVVAIFTVWRDSSTDLCAFSVVVSSVKMLVQRNFLFFCLALALF